MHGPVGLARDGSGAIYVTEHGETLSSPPGSGGSYVSKYTLSGNTATRVWRKGGIGNGNGTFANTGPYGVAVSGSSLLIADSFNSRVQTWDLNGNYQSEFPVPSTLPLGLSIDSSGNLWIAESSDNGGGPIQQVQKASPAGAYLNVTLTGGLSLPFDAVLNAATNRVYVADYGNDRVAVFDLGGTQPGNPPVINSAASATGTVGSPFSYTITASNSPTSFAISSGTLPAGLSLSGATISGTPTAAASANVTLTATNASGTSAPFTLAITINAASAATPTGPAVTAINFDLGTVTNSTGSYDVTFDQPVTGVDASDFVFTTQGNATTTITSVTGSGSAYRVNFNYGGNSGSVQLSIKSSGTGIVDASNNPFIGAGLTASAPTPFQAAPPADSTAPSATMTVGTASGSTVNFTLTFSEAVTGVDAADFVLLRSAGATGSIGAVSGSGTTYTIPVTFGGSGSIQLLSFGGTTANIRDAATNWYTGGASATFNIPSTGMAPSITSATSAAGTVGTAFTYQIAATNSPTSYAATNLSGTGLSLNTTTGAITGTPTAAATITSQLTATNAL
jgi:hypothetical protein